MVFIENVQAMEGFIKKEINLSESHGFNVIGFFPYHYKAIRKGPGLPREMFKDLWHIFKLNGINDNKIVVVCEDTVNFGTDDFAMNFKDFYVRIGKLEDIQDY